MKMKPWIIAGVSCLCAGTICCGAAVCAGALDQNRYRENLHLIDQTDTPSETFTSVLMDIDNADVTVQNGSKFSITAENVPQNSYHVAVEDDTLQIQLNSDSEPWYSYTHFGFHPFHAPAAKITVTLPAEYRAVAIANHAGDCTISGIHVSTLSVDLDYGDCQVKNVTAANLTADNDAGDLLLSDSTVSGTASLELDYGDLTVKQTEIGNLCKVKNDAGDVRLTDVSCGSSEMELDYGSLKLQRFTETDQAQFSAFTIFDGDVHCETSTLWNSSFDLEFGDFSTIDTVEDLEKELKDKPIWDGSFYTLFENLRYEDIASGKFHFGEIKKGIERFERKKKRTYCKWEQEKDVFHIKTNCSSDAVSIGTDLLSKIKYCPCCGRKIKFIGEDQ